MSEFKARLVRFYEKYAPEKLDGVDDLLAKSKGKEEKLFGKLVDKYGPEPEVGEVKKSALALSREVEEEEEHNSSKQSSSKKKAAKEESASSSAKALAGEEEEGEVAAAGQSEDDYGSRAWWKARLVRFYAKYAPEKKEADIEALLVKAKDNPAQLLKLFNMLEQKYGPEPDPSSSEEEEEDAQQQEEADEEEEEEEEEAQIAGLRRVVYCPVDGVPPEYSEYFDTFAQALPWLAANAPDLVLQTKQGVTVGTYAKEKGVEPLSEGAKVSKSDKAKERKRGGAKKGDGKIVIESKEQRKKAITIVKGMDGVEGIKLKEVSKALGKKFASGCSIKSGQTGDEYLEIQGDWSYDLPEVLVTLFPVVKKDQVYVVNADGKKEAAF